MRKPLFLISFAIALGAAGCAQAMSVSPDTTFYASGTFSDLATLGGTVDIDTVAGTVLDGDLTVSTVSGDFTLLAVQGSGSDNDYFAEFLNGAWVLDLDIQASTLVGYAGGPLCSTAGNCESDETVYYLMGGDDPPLSGGSLSLAATAPEPSTWMLLLAAGPVLLGIRRFRKLVGV